ncbi:MAG: LAGLIDADG family homing endonuclease [Candidatus Parcubacteria bacterium]|nr:LAGLIDADG family homing endonuclease [Candidatus Parcubacteria bacterium]
MKPLSNVKNSWSPDFAYVIGLMATDGNLSPDGRHLHFTSKDLELAALFKRILGLSNKIGRKSRGDGGDKKYFVVQFGDINFYRFLLSIGLMPNKSKILGSLKIPDKYFKDFLRGCIDGDGNIHCFKHPESQFPQLRVRIASASNQFLIWLKAGNAKILKLAGGWIEKGKGVNILCYGSKDSLRLLKNIYKDKASPYLRRKFLKAEPFMRA